MPDTGFPLFAFRLHQFFSRGDAVYASIGPSDERYVTTQAQQFDPTDAKRERVLLPLAFCRECGQDYYVVHQEGVDNARALTGRALSDVLKDEDRLRGFVFLNDRNEWPVDEAEVLRRLPEDWVEEGPRGHRVKSSSKARVPQNIRIGHDGIIGVSGWHAGCIRSRPVPVLPHLQCHLQRLAELATSAS